MPTTGFFMSIPARSSFSPDQSPQYLTFKMAVGKNETSAAEITITAVKTGRFFASGSNGNTSNAHGKSSGRLLALAPTNNAAANPDIQRSLTRRELHARQPKSIAA